MKEHFLNRKFSENEVKDSYSKVAWFYNLWSLLTESKAAKKTIEFADIKDGESILEVALGTGVVFKEIVKRNNSGINKGIDISPSMLSRAKKHLNELNNRNFMLEIANAYHLPFKDNSFDLVINNFMIDLMPEKDFKKILSEFYRVIKPRGRTVISTMAFGEKWYNKFWHWIAGKFPNLLTGCRPVSIVFNLKEVGFTVIKSEQISQNTFPSEVIYAIKNNHQ
jgi:ubiquinone/menaquinone biosynthesis C-methylase UbiE